VRGRAPTHHRRNLPLPAGGERAGERAGERGRLRIAYNPEPPTGIPETGAARGGPSRVRPPPTGAFPESNR